MSNIYALGNVGREAHRLQDEHRQNHRNVDEFGRRLMAPAGWLGDARRLANSDNEVDV